MSCHTINIFTIEAERGLNFCLVCFGKLVLTYVHGSYTIDFNLLSSTCVLWLPHGACKIKTFIQSIGVLLSFL